MQATQAVARDGHLELMPGQERLLNFPLAYSCVSSDLRVRLIERVRARPCRPRSFLGGPVRADLQTGMASLSFDSKRTTSRLPQRTRRRPTKVGTGPDSDSQL